MVVRSMISSEHFSKISLMDAGIMLTWFLTKSHWLPANVKIRIEFLTILGLGH